MNAKSLPPLAFALVVLAAPLTASASDPDGNGLSFHRHGGKFLQAWSDCAPDRHRFCSNIVPGSGRIVRCLVDNRDRVTDRCSRHVEKVATVQSAWRACSTDVQKYCRDVVPGGGRVVSCLAGNRDRLSPRCRRGIHEAEDTLRY